MGDREVMDCGWVLTLNLLGGFAIGVQDRTLPLHIEVASRKGVAVSRGAREGSEALRARRRATYTDILRRCGEDVKVRERKLADGRKAVDVAVDVVGRRREKADRGAAETKQLLWRGSRRGRRAAGLILSAGGVNSATSQPTNARHCEGGGAGAPVT